MCIPNYLKHWTYRNEKDVQSLSKYSLYSWNEIKKHKCRQKVLGIGYKECSQEKPHKLGNIFGKTCQHLNEEHSNSKTQWMSMP